MKEKYIKLIMCSIVIITLIIEFSLAHYLDGRM